MTTTTFSSYTKNPLLSTVALCVFLFLFSCTPKSKYPGPLSPEASMKTFRFADNFKAEIFATEPLVIDPVDMEFDEEGNAYVVSMIDAYKPDSVKGKDKIIMLKDLNDDGRADTAIVFADNLREATSVLPWKGGLLIAAAPNIMYYKDTDGDGRADQKEILFSGFFTGNEEAQITNLRFGIDNWIYANNTGQAGEVTFSENPDGPALQMRGSDFRFRLDRKQYELTTGAGQFGLALDDCGHRFFTTNSIHIQQAVAPKRYLARNPALPSALKSGAVNISDHDPIMFQISETPYWRQERTDRRNKQYQENKLDRVEYARDHFTGASGGTFYGGDRFPEGYYGNIFTTDVAGNLVHRDILVPSDSEPHFIAQRGAQEKDKEFLATTDTWFRPANFSVGPDGYLYLIDMYRQHIETPLSIPEDLQTDMDMNAGNTMGRIYRIVPSSDNSPKSVKADLKSATNERLIEALSHTNRWWRMTAQRLLLERQDKSVIPLAKALFTESKNPQSRLHALYVLEGLDALDASMVATALQDANPGVRENAANLAERFPACRKQLEQLVEDTAVRVAYQATLSVGTFRDANIVPILAKAVLLHGNSKWFRAAVLSAEAGSAPEILKVLAAGNFTDSITDWKISFYKELAETIGARNQPAQVSSLLRQSGVEKYIADPKLQSAVVKGLAAGLQNAAGTTDAIKEKLKAIVSSADTDAAQAQQQLLSVYTAMNKK